MERGQRKSASDMSPAHACLPRQHSSSDRTSQWPPLSTAVLAAPPSHLGLPLQRLLRRLALQLPLMLRAPPLLIRCLLGAALPLSTPLLLPHLQGSERNRKQGG